MKKSAIYVTAVVLVVILAVVILILRNPKDDWIKDEKGVWIKHGNPLTIPTEVLEQQSAINSAIQIYNQKKTERMNFSSQCLGVTNGYAIDIVHVPRNQEDNLKENQCEEFSKTVWKFMEFDKDGQIIRVVE